MGQRSVKENNMDKIIVKHSRIEIHNYEMGDCRKLEYIFSIWKPVEHKTIIKAIEYDRERKVLTIPRGVDVSYIENLFQCDAVMDRKCDEFVDREPIPIKYLTRDEDQLKTLKFLLGKDEYYYTKTKSQLSVNNNTGTGKTFVAVASICFTGRRAIIITSNIDWLNQWREKIKEYTPLTDNDIYTITGAGSINKILTKDPLQYTIFLASHTTLKSYGDKHGWDSVGNLFKYLKCGYKIYDEAHLYFDNIYRIDYHTNTKRTLYLTATAERSDRDENDIYQLYFKNVPSIDLFNPEEDPHTHYNALHFNSHPSAYEINDCRNAYGFNRIAYTNYVIETENFNKLLMVLIDMGLNISGKILIYIGTNHAITEVYENIIAQFPFLKDHIGIYTSLTKTDKSEQLKKKFILSTTKSCGAANDIADLACTINLAEPFKSPVLARQTLGRTRGDNTMYIDVVDEGMYYCKRYYKDKKPIFNRYAKSCHDVFMDDYELDKRFNELLKKYDNKVLMCSRVFDK
jgi:hypothetical protein